MQKTDVVLPNGNESELIQMAIRIGFTDIIFLTTRSDYVYKSIHSRIRVHTAYLIKNMDEISRMRKRFDYIFARAERQFFESDVDFVVGLEAPTGNDSFHYRNTAFNQVHARLCKEHNIKIALDIGMLKNVSFVETLCAFGRMMQDATLIKKQRLSSSCYSFATKPYEMMPPESLIGVAAVLGLKTFK